MARSADEIYDRLGDLIDAINNGGLATGGSTGVARGSIGRGYSASFGGRDNNEYNVKKNKSILEFNPNKGETEKYMELLELQDEYNKKAEGAREELEELNNLRKEGIDLTDEQLEREKELQGVLQEQNNIKAQLNGQSFLGSFGNDLNKIVGGVKNLGREIKQQAKAWFDANEAVTKYARTMGMSKAAARQLHETTQKYVADNKVTAKYGLKSDDLIKTHEDFSKSSGRNIRLSNDDQLHAGLINKLVGAKGVDLAGALDNFGVGAYKTSKMLAKMFSDASKQGISFEKYSDNVAKNIKLAQNYTFKNGIKGLENMAKKATVMKMDMQQVAALADKVSTVEGAIDVSSKLQVLGGPFAQLADPMGMLNEGLNDMEGLQDRLIKMVGNMGSFNKKTGEVEVSSFNKQRIKAAASAMGVSYDSLMESANAQARRGEIGKQIEASANAKGLSEDVKELIKNSGTFKDGKAGVSIGGKFKTLDQITNADKEALQRESNTEAQDLRLIAETLMSTNEKEDAILHQVKEEIAAKMNKTLYGYDSALDGLREGNWLYGMLKGILIAVGVSSAINTIGNLGKAVKGLWNGGKKVVNFVKNGKVGKTVSKIAKSTKNAVKNTVSKATRGTTNAVKNSAGRWIDPKTGRYVSTKSVTPSSGGRLSNFASKVSNGARNAFNTTKSGLTKGFTAAKSGLTKGFTAAKSGISSAWNVAKTKGGSLLKTAKGGLSKLTSKFGGTALKAVAKTGLKSAAKIGGKLALGMAKGGPLGIVGAIGDVATDALVASGKIKKGGVAHNMLSAGSGAASGAAMGAMIGSVIPGVGTLIGGAVGAVVGGIKGLWKAGGLQKIGKGIKNAAGKAWKGVRNFTKNVGNRIKNSKVGKAVGSAIKKIKNSKVGKAVGSAINKVKNSKVGRALSKVGGFLRNPFGIKKAKPRKTQAQIEAERREAQMQKLRAKTADASKDVLAKYKQNIKPIPEKGANATYGGVDKANKDIKIKTDPHDVNINGTLSIKGENGQTINIVDELKRNPDMLRSVTSMISNEMGVIERGANIQYA